MRIWIAAAAIFLLAAEAASAAASQDNTPPEYHDYIVEAQLDSARAAAREGNFELVMVSLAKSLDPSVYAQLSPKRQHEVIALYGFAAIQIGAWRNAQQAYKIATANSEASLDDWSYRLMTARVLNDPLDALETFRTVGSQSAQLASGLTFAELAIFDAQFASLEDGGNARLEFATILDQAGWQTPDPFEEGSSYWLPYMVTLIEKGEFDKAQRVAARITDYKSIISMRADRRFDAIVAADRARLEPRLAAQTWLSNMEREAARATDHMEGQIAVARALHTLNRDQEALRILQSVIDEVERAESRETRFMDFSSQVGNLYMWKGEILVALRKYDEGFAALRRSASIWRDLNSHLVLAARLNVNDRPEEALAELSNLGLRSRPRRPVDFAEILACTLAHLGRRNELETEIAYLRRHERTNPDRLVTALLCADDKDGAAQAYIAMLKDPHHRLMALNYLQTYSDSGVAPYSRIMRERKYAVRARRDVQAAITAVGRILAYDLPLN